MNHRKHIGEPCSPGGNTPFHGGGILRNRLLRRPWWGIPFLALLLVLPAFAARADSGVPEGAIVKARALIDGNEHNRNNMQEAIGLLQGAEKESKDIRIPLYLAEAYYRMADPAADIDKSFPLYEKAGMQAKKVVDRAPARLEGHYWYGLYLLKKAQKQGGIWAYFTVKDGIRELEKVRKSLPGYDHGGASRVLGLLYCIAPGWSPFGDLDKSVKLEKEAISLAPNYLLNRLYLARAYQKKGDKEEAVQEYRNILATSLGESATRTDHLYQKEARKMLASLGLSSKVLPD
jgi:tetratricopeptide (TPR) repeat protein